MLPLPPNNERRRQIRIFISQNWKTMTDEEMAKMLELQEYQVRKVRLQLKLLRTNNLLTDKTEQQKFLDLLKKHHYNMSKVAEDLDISREAVRQKVIKLGIKIEKSPAFYTLTHEHPWLIKASSFALEFYMAGSVVNLSHKYELDATVIHRFADELGLSLSPPKAPAVKSACSFCHKEILRPRYQMKSKTYFCSKTCQGKWLGQKSLGRKRNEKLTKLNCVDCGKLLGRFGSTDDAKSTTARCMNCYRKQQKANQQKREDFILQNWPALSDEQISVKLGLKIPKVAIIRYSLGLKKKDRLDPKARTEATNFIRQNWQNMTDDEITTALGLKLFSIQQIRRSLGLKRPTGRGREKIEECRSFIQENWQTQSDKKMVKALGVSLPSIRRIRLELGLFRRPKK